MSGKRLNKHGDPIINWIDVLLKFLFEQIGNLFDRVFAIALLPDKTPQAVQFDPKMRFLQSRQNIFDQPFILKFGFQKDHESIAGFFKFYISFWDEMEQIIFSPAIIRLTDFIAGRLLMMRSVVNC